MAADSGDESPFLLLPVLLLLSTSLLSTGEGARVAAAAFRERGLTMGLVLTGLLPLPRLHPPAPRALLG